MATLAWAEAKLLDRDGGLRRGRDLLVFDPVHSHGLPEYNRIIATLAGGWPASAFRPHRGHLFSLHVAAGLGLGEAEMNPACFLPFGGPGDGATVVDGELRLSDAPGIGFEWKEGLMALFKGLL